MYNRVQVKARAKQSLSGKWGIAIGTTIIASLILSVCGCVPVVGAIATIVLAGVIGVGLAIIMLEIVRNWDVQFGDLFKGFNNFGTNCLAGVLVSVFTFLWSLLFVIPGIVKFYSYAMTFYILADHPEMKPKDAIEASKVMMDGHKMDLFVLDLSFILWHILVGVSFGLAALYVGPYVAASKAMFYETIKNEKVAAPYVDTPAQNANVVEEAPVDETVE